MTQACSQVSSPLVVPAHIESLKAYQPGRPAEQAVESLRVKRLINMASNENPAGPPPAALQAMSRFINECNRYPEPSYYSLREKLAAKFHVDLHNVAVGSGSSGIIENIMRAFLTLGDEVITSEGTFVGFYVTAQSSGARLKVVPLRDYHFDLDAIAEAISPATRLVYLCNPNNPTGTTFTRAEFEAFMERVPRQILVLVDEAYAEYVPESEDYPDSMSYGYDNVVTLRTFSKVYGMAGVRLGYGIASEFLIKYINKVKMPFEPNMLAQAAGVAALDDQEFLLRTIENNEVSRKIVCDEFDRLGLSYIPTRANFVCVPYETPQKVQHLHQSLLAEGIAIRPLGGFGLPHCFRVTTGIPDECQEFIEAFRRFHQP